MITRKLGKVLRGNATPAQLMLACLLGSALGFVPGITQAPGLIVLLTLALVILNGNLAVAVLLGAVAELVSFLILPVSFAVGGVLLDGPTQPLFRALINAPVLALFGFEYYATTGGLLVGLIFGLLVGILLITIVRRFRRIMAGLDASEQAQRWLGKWWVKLAAFIFVGGGAKENYSSLLEKKGKVIRPIGVLFAALVVVLLVLAQMFMAGPIVTAALQRGLERANGATVDLKSAEIDLADGRMTVMGLAVADPNALDTDLLRAAKIEADLSATSLLRKRLKIDRIVISEAVNGAQRETPGRIVGKAPAPRPALELPDPRQGEKTLEDYLQDSRRWQQRLAQVRQWLETLSGPAERAAAAGEEQERESLRDRLEREAAALGYARVKASHLIEGAPQLTVGELLAEGVHTEALEGETLDLKARNISTHPNLLPEAPSISIKSSGNTLELGLELGSVSASAGRNRVDFAYRGLPVDDIAGNLAGGGTQPISGGTIDVTLQGTFQVGGGTFIDLPLQVTLHDTTITVAGAGSAPVEQLTLPLGLRGPLDNLRIRIDDAAFADALKAAGASVLAGEVRRRADELLKDAAPDLNLKDGIEGIDLKKGVEGIDLKQGLPGIGAQKEEAKDKDKKSEESDKSADKAREKAKDLTKGLFGGKKTKKKDKP